MAVSTRSLSPVVRRVWPVCSNCLWARMSTVSPDEPRNRTALRSTTTSQSRYQRSAPARSGAVARSISPAIATTTCCSAGSLMSMLTCVIRSTGGGQVKTLTPPGPTRRPTTTSTMPSSTCPRTAVTMPAMTRITARIHSSAAMRPPSSVGSDAANHHSHNHLIGRLCTPLGMITFGGVTPRRAPVRVALVDDYDVVVIGVAHLFDAYKDRIVVAELDTNEPVHDSVDVVLYDSFAQPEADQDDVAVLVASPHARHVVVYTWNFHPSLVDGAMAKG